MRIAPLILILLAAATGPPTGWRLERTATIAGHPTRALGQPRVIDSAQGSAVRFDGTRAGLCVP